MVTKLFFVASAAPRGFCTGPASALPLSLSQQTIAVCREIPINPFSLKLIAAN
jgi:hypothetical protein